MNTMSDQILNQIKAQSFQDGVQYALEYLSSLYDGIYETDIAKQYAKNCELCEINPVANDESDICVSCGPNEAQTDGAN